MLSYFIKRLFTGLAILFIYTSFLFFLSQEILPGDYVSQFVLELTPDEAQELREIFELDKPIWKRYLNWIARLVQGDLGISYAPFWSERPRVSDVIAQTLPPTMLVFGIGTLIAFLLGQWLGRVAAWRGTGFLSSSITFFSIAFYTCFPPWLVFLLVYLLTHILDVPISLGSRSLMRAPRMSGIDVMVDMLLGFVIALVLMVVVNSLLRRSYRCNIPMLIFIILLSATWILSWFIFDIVEPAMQILRLAILPIVAYTLLSFGEVMLIMRTTMLDTIHEDYVVAARAKGLPEHIVRNRYAARNAMLPVLSRLVISIPFLLTGMVMIEEVLNWGGIGRTLFYAIGMQNVPLTVGLVLVVGVISLLARLFLEILQATLDPRVCIRT